MIATAGVAAADPDPNGTWSWAIQTGVMTNDRAADSLNLAKVELVDEYLVGFVIGYDRQIAESRFSFGAEFQINAHFGDQDFVEFALPVSLRYHPKTPWLGAFESFAFGLGYSYYSEVSDLERSNYGGTSREGLIYYYVEAEFAELTSGDNIFARLHHRSDGYGTLEPDGASNALIVGLRRDF